MIQSKSEEKAEKRLEEIDLIRRRHQIYMGIAGKDIDLMNADPPGRTDCENFIAIPIEDPEAALIHQHEWQHIFFKSDLRARAAFVESYLQRIETQHPGIFGSSSPSRLSRQDVENFLCVFINGMDDIRVCSLWEDPYPQSAEDIQTRWKRILLTTKRYEKDITMFMMALGLGLEGQLSQSTWMRYKAVLLDGMEKVKKKAFPACLLAARWVLDSIIEDVLNIKKAGGDAYQIGPPPPLSNLPTGGPSAQGFGKPLLNRPQAPQATAAPVGDRASSIEDTLKKLVQGHQNRARGMMNAPPSMMDTDVTPTGPDPNYKHTKQIVDAAMGVSTENQVKFLLHQAQIEVDLILSALRGKTKRLTKDQRLLKGMSGSISFVDVKPSMVDEQVLDPEDKRALLTLRHRFTKLMDRKRFQSTDSGSTLDPSSYIDMMLGGGDLDIFLEETSSRGFSALIALDMSGSMMDDWPAVSRACKVLAKAMKFPFSSLEVWGFSSDRGGDVTIFRFEDTEKGYSSNRLRGAWGLTPLHMAAEVAVRRLRTMPGSCHHLFVLTDGVPVHVSGKSGYIPGLEELIALTAYSFREGRKNGVHTSGLVIGYSVENEVADAMFGHRRFWSRVDSERGDLFKSLISLVQSAFVNYLKGR